MLVRRLASALIPGQQNIFLVITQDHQTWLANTGAADVKLTACELGGFNTGRFDEIPTGLYAIYMEVKHAACDM